MNQKQKRFAREYTKDFNATKASTRAGYCKRSTSIQGSRMLRNNKVLKEIDKHVQDLKSLNKKGIANTYKEIVDLIEGAKKENNVQLLILSLKMKVDIELKLENYRVRLLQAGKTYQNPIQKMIEKICMEKIIAEYFEKHLS